MRIALTFIFLAANFVACSGCENESSNYSSPDVGDSEDTVDGCSELVERTEICSESSCMKVGLRPRFERALSGELSSKIVEGVFLNEGDGYWFFLAQRGVVIAVSEATGESHIAADLTDRVRSRAGEEGLLGIAFSPEFPDTSEVYLSYTTDSDGSGGDSVVTRMPVDTSDWTFDSDQEREVIRQEQPAGNHNGGKIAFGPDDLLYISWGDGGGGNNEFGNGQDRNTLLGTILRIDVLTDSTSFGKAYGIPADNPFVDADGADEIYAYGLRNTWKFSFDRNDGRLFAGDVGQNEFEEVDIIEKGGNYGWSLKEGFACFDADEPCDASQLGVIDPIWNYDHSKGASITGGFVYRGSDIPILDGRYLTADYANGNLWFLTDQGDGTWNETLIKDTAFAISSFAETQTGEILLMNYRFDDGPVVYQLTPLPEECE